MRGKIKIALWVKLTKWGPTKYFAFQSVSILSEWKGNATWCDPSAHASSVHYLTFHAHKKTRPYRTRQSVKATGGGDFADWSAVQSFLSLHSRARAIDGMVFIFVSLFLGHSDRVRRAVNISFISCILRAVRYSVQFDVWCHGDCDWCRISWRMNFRYFVCIILIF